MAQHIPTISAITPKAAITLCHGCNDSFRNHNALPYTSSM
jgi:hypothetical protein